MDVAFLIIGILVAAAFFAGIAGMVLLTLSPVLGGLRSWRKEGFWAGFDRWRGPAEPPWT